MADFSLNFLVITWVVDPSKLFKTKDMLNTAIYKRLSKAGIEIPFPTSTVHYKEIKKKEQKEDAE